MKIKIFVTALIIGLLHHLSWAQIDSDAVLFTLDGEPTTASEFIRVYKKNLDLVKDESQKDIDKYFKLFVNYKLKIKEAKALGFDEKPSYKREFENYRKQLSKNYLTDHKVTEELIKEAYQRSQYDVHVVHILIRLDGQLNDTSKVYQKMLNYKERLANEDFEAIKTSLPSDSDIIAEDLGYFSAFKMVYNFESAAYNTPVGEVSDPFRTRFGYHVLKVLDKRESRGEVTVGHIMLANKNNDSIEDPAVKINEIHRLLLQGETFESLAKQFSQDRSTAQNGGKLKSFKSGQLTSQIFEDKAFSLTNVGEISEPFQTEYGWHIAKLYDKKGNPSYDEAKSQIEQRVKRDIRSQVITEAFVDSLKTFYKVNTETDLSYFKGIIDKSYFTSPWSIPQDLPKEKVLFKIEGNAVKYHTFANYLKGIQKRMRVEQPIDQMVEDQYKSFTNQQILKYHEDNLEKVNAEYAHVLAEYRDGLLLFDLMQEKVWNAVQRDTMALETYYNKNKAKYTWPERIDAVIATGSDPKIIAQVKQSMEAGTSIDTLNQQINTDSKQNVIFTYGKFERGDRVLPKEFKFEKGVSKIYNDNNAYYVIHVKEIVPEALKSFEEARGNVISEYQVEYENLWIEELQKKYQLQVDEQVYKGIKSQINK